MEKDLMEVMEDEEIESQTMKEAEVMSDGP